MRKNRIDSYTPNNEVLNAIGQVCEDSKMRQAVAIKLANAHQSNESEENSFKVLSQWRANLPEPKSGKKFVSDKC